MPSFLAAALAATLIPIPPDAVPAGPPPPAAADAPSPVPAERAPPVPPGARWYGLPALAIDGLALTLAASGFAAKGGGVFVLGAAGYFLAAPINHIVNRRPGVAAGSFLIRALASGIAFGIFVNAYSSEHCDGDVYADHPCQHETALVLGTLVLGTAALIDDVALARAAPPPPRPARGSLAPGLVLTPKLGMVSLGGSF